MNCKIWEHGDESLNLQLYLSLIESLSIRLLRGQGFDGTQSNFSHFPFFRDYHNQDRCVGNIVKIVATSIVSAI